MKRQGWRAALAIWARARLGSTFEWGKTDCALIALEAFDAMTGMREAENYRFRYATREQALRFQRRKKSLPAFLEDMGCLKAKYPEAGDLIVLDREGFQTGYVCFGPTVLSAWPDEGVSLGMTSDLLARGATIYRVS